MMKQQVQDAILARSVQAAKGNELGSDWRFVGCLGHLKTFKLRGADPFSSSSSWATTLEKTTRATACTLNGRDGVNKYSRRQRRTGGRSVEASMSRSTIGGRRDPLDPRPPLQSFRTFGRVQGNYRDIVGVHYAVNSADFVQQQKLLSPGVIDGAVLRTIRATKESYLGIKWLAENSFSGKRDVCFVEMVGYTITPNGQEVGFVTTASVDVPECPELSGSMKVTRVRMKRTMVVIPTAEATSEVFVMGASEANEASIIANAQYRLSMAILNDISLVIDSQSIAKQTLVRRESWVSDDVRPSCTICSRKFHFVSRRRHHCRLCGDVICKSCYVNRSVPRADTQGEPTAVELCQTKFCLRCVVGLRAVDRRLEEFSPQVSKMLSLDVDSSTAEDFEEWFELESPDSNPRASSLYTFFKNAQDHLDTTAASSAKEMELTWNTTADRLNSRATVTIGGIGSLGSFGSGKFARS